MDFDTFSSNKDSTKDWFFSGFSSEAQEDILLPREILTKIYNSLVGNQKVALLQITDLDEFPTPIAVCVVLEILELSRCAYCTSSHTLTNIKNSILRQVFDSTKDNPDSKSIVMSVVVALSVLKCFTSGTSVDHHVESNPSPTKNTAPTSLDNFSLAPKVVNASNPPAEKALRKKSKLHVNTVGNCQVKPLIFAMLHSMAQYRTENDKQVIAQASQPQFNSRAADLERIAAPMELVYTSAQGASTTLEDHYVTVPYLIHDKRVDDASINNELPRNDEFLQPNIIHCTNMASPLRRRALGLPLHVRSAQSEVDDFFEFCTKKTPEKFFGDLSGAKGESVESFVNEFLKSLKLQSWDRNYVLVTLGLCHLSASLEGLATVGQWEVLKVRLCKHLIKKNRISKATMATICHGVTCGGDSLAKFADSCFVPCRVMIQAAFRVRLAFIEGNNRAHAIINGILNIHPMLGDGIHSEIDQHSSPSKSIFAQPKTIDLASVSCDANLVICWVNLKPHQKHFLAGNKEVRFVVETVSWKIL